MAKKPSIETEVESESIIHGEPLTGRKSTFQAHVAEVYSMDEVYTNHYLQERLSLSHKILNLRLRISDTQIYWSDSQS